MEKMRSLISKLLSKLPKKKKFPLIHLNRVLAFYSGFQQEMDKTRQLPLTLIRHKFLLGGVAFSVLLIVFMAVSIYRGYFMISTNNTANAVLGTSTNSKMNKAFAKSSPKPTSINPSPTDILSPSESTVLGTYDTSTYVPPTVVPPTAVPPTPFPTFTPEPTSVPVTVPATTTSSNSSGNSSCTTGSGVPNSWYSDVYPNPPITTSNGNITLIVDIRDCSIHNVSSVSKLKVLLSSGDPNTQVNGQSLPVTVSTQNGQASFSVSSQIAGTVVLTVQDTTDSFTVTNIDNNNPSIVFSIAPATSTPIPTTTGSVSPTSNPTPTIIPASTSTPTVIPTPTATLK